MYGCIYIYFVICFHAVCMNRLVVFSLKRIRYTGISRSNEIHNNTGMSL